MSATIDHPQLMKAAILTEQRHPLAIGEIQLPSNLEYGQVLVEIRYSGICGSQIGEQQGAKGPDHHLPHLLGHEGSGIVIQTGPGVQTVANGDHVVLHWRKGAGIEAKPPTYRWDDQTINAGWVTTFNEYAIVSENRITTIPKDFDLRLAPLYGCAITTGFGVVVNNAKLSIGESIAIFGSGGIGLSIIQAAAMVSAHPIIAIDLTNEKLALAKQLGATHTINSATEDVQIRLDELTGGKGVDVAVDNTGNTSIIEIAYENTNPTGRMILVGVPLKDDRTALYTLPLHFGKILTGSHGGEAQPEIDIPKYIHLFNQGKYPLRPLITDCFDLDDINSAMMKMARHEIVGRCLIRCNSAKE